MSFLKEMAYPSNFSMEEFESIRSHAKKIKYASERLKKIGVGSSRVVFQIDDEKVLKVAKNQRGVMQNEVEADYSLQNYALIAKVFESSENPNGVMWLEMELAKKVNPKRFEQLSGYSMKTLNDFLLFENERINPRNRISIQSQMTDEQHQEMWENEFISDLMTFTSSYDMVIPGDLIKLNSWGEVIKDGEDSLVLIDFGFNKRVQYKYYGTN